MSWECEQILTVHALNITYKSFLFVELAEVTAMALVSHQLNVATKGDQPTEGVPQGKLDLFNSKFIYSFSRILAVNYK